MVVALGALLEVLYVRADTGDQVAVLGDGLHDVFQFGFGGGFATVEGFALAFEEAICFSNLALSNRSVLPERMATYSEKFMPPCSSMLPSSMVRAPIVPFLSWVMNNCLL